MGQQNIFHTCSDSGSTLYGADPSIIQCDFCGSIAEAMHHNRKHLAITCVTSFVDTKEKPMNITTYRYTEMAPEPTSYCRYHRSQPKKREIAIRNRSVLGAR